MVWGNLRKCLGKSRGENLRNSLSQSIPKLDADWLAPHHPIPNIEYAPV